LHRLRADHADHVIGIIDRLADALRQDVSGEKRTAVLRHPVPAPLQLDSQVADERIVDAGVGEKDRLRHPPLTALAWITWTWYSSFQSAASAMVMAAAFFSSSVARVTALLSE